MKTIKYLFYTVFISISALLGYATFVEQAKGADYTSELVYHTWWFFTLWTILVVTSCLLMYRARLWRRFSVCLLHGSFIVILAGAAISFLTSKEGTIHLRDNHPENSFIEKESGKVCPLPFMLQLDSFRIEYYVGTEAPSDFNSYLKCMETDGKLISHALVSMNNTLDMKGYRFYQSSFDIDEKGTILTVNYDPWGTPVTYFGYALFGISMLMVLLSRKEEFRRLLSNPMLRKTALLLCLTCALPGMAGQRSVPTINKEKAERATRMQIIYNDRVAPLNTMARDFIQKIYGKSSYKGLTAEQVVYGWLYRPETWKNERMIKIKDGNLRRKLGITGKYASVADLFDGNEYKLTGMIQQEGDTKAIREVDEKVGLILMLTEGTLIKPLPQNVEPLPDRQVEAEILYNAIPFTKILFMLNLTIGMLLMTVLMTSPRLYARCSVAATAIFYLSLAMVVVGYALRWYISGRVPLGNGYETMLFLVICVMVITATFRRRLPFVLPFGFLMSGFILLVAHLGEMNPQITPLMPVLASPLLSIHVSVIMMAYALFAFTFLIGVYALTGQKTDRQQLEMFSQLLLYPAIFLLGAGIFLGAVWANVSWGKYWSWDPKEVWALITFLVYAVPFHKQSPILKISTTGYHIYMVLAFLSVLMTYFGVNYFLGGMHSYA